MAEDDKDENVEKLDKIEVVGSRIKRTDIEGVSPVLTVTREELEISGHNTIQDFIRTLTITSGNTGDDNNNSFASGTSTINLRGLGNNATLVLINGRRMAAHGQAQNITESFVDLNSIPMAAVERIEILKDGASAIYGADAVGGVVNLVLRKNFTGAEYTVGYQTDVDGDAPQSTFSAIIGGGNDNTDFTLTFSALDREALFYRDRNFSASADQRANGGFDQRSTFGFPGTVFSPSAGTFTAHPDCDADLVRPQFGGTVCSLNFNDFINFYPDSQRYSSNLYMNHKITEKINLYLDFGVNVNKSVNIAAPAPWVGPFSNGINTSGPGANSILPPEASAALPFGGLMLFVPQSNPFNTFGEDIGLLHRPIGFGPRVAEKHTTTYRFNTGVEGYFGESSWEYDVGFGYSRSNVLVEHRNSIDAVKLQSALLGVLDPNGSGETIYYNPFGDNDQRVIDFAKLVYEDRNVSWERSFIFNFTGPLLSMPAGDLGLAVGAEVRKQFISAEADPLRNSGGLVGTGQANDTFGDRDVTSFYAEFSVPLLKSLELQLAARYEDYSDFGTTTKPKIGLRWQPIKDLLLRASWGESFRAPSLTELFSGVVTSFPGGLIDPVRCPSPGSPAGVNGNAPDLSGTDCGNGQNTVNNGGNSNLSPEESESVNFGVVWEPSFFDGFNLSLDYFRFKHENIITQLQNQLLINLNDPRFVIRNGGPTSPISLIKNTFINGAFREVSGVDFGLAYQREIAGGIFQVSNNLTYYETFEFAPIRVDASGNQTIGAVIDGTGNTNLGDFPILRDNLSLSYSFNKHSISAIGHYRSGLDATNANSITGSNETSSWSTLDLAYTYFVGDKSKLQVGCINCTDRDPIFDPDRSEEAGYFKSTDDPRGAVVYIRWTQGF
jgi:outer membrane receptor for ferrienterochelin and colicin